MANLLRTLTGRVQSAPQGSYTKRLLDDPELLKAKLIEEAQELAQAGNPGEVAHEAADVFYFALVAMARSGVDLATVERALEKRSLKITRRPGDAKNNT
jgi:phosphoribosyl-ATP pyrophosphohydrolase